MPIHYDGEHEVRLYYQVSDGTNVLTHRMTFDVNITETVTPGEDPTTIDVNTHAGGTLPLQNQVAAFVALLQPFFHTGVDFTYFELWRYESEGYDAIYLATGSIALNGTSATAVSIAQQQTITLRSAGGNIMRVQMMEPSTGGNAVISYPFPAGNTKNLADYLIGTTHGIVARDNTRPIVGYRDSRGQNEKLYRQRFRQ